VGRGGAGNDNVATDYGLSPQEPLGGFFRYGINGGFPNPNWSDQDLALLEVARGCNSQRVSLPETHLAKWGWEIEKTDLSKSGGLGLSGHVGFLTSPTREHSTASANVEDWELVHYLPKNLYEPILTDDGTINPNNYWGKYVYETVKTYKDYIKTWEVWNEPDWVENWQVTEDWKNRPPAEKELPRFNGSIFDYIRMLRVSKIAANLADQEAKIATGGLGYSSFLAAILRYTDNPIDGTVTEKYPETGGTYLDVLSFHHYPIYTDGNSDDALDGYLSHVDEFLAEIKSAKTKILGWENTETGAPHVATGKFPGGDQYAINYLLKVMTQAHARGIDGVDWFVLSDSKTATNADDPYQLMGLYLPVSELKTIAEATPTNTGIAYKTLAQFLSKARFDSDRTKQLGLTEPLRGSAFRTADGKSAVVIWVRAQGVDETATTTTYTSKDAYSMYDWDYAATGKVTSFSVGDDLPLSTNPRIFVAKD
jgi:hypothetical protein